MCKWFLVLLAITASIAAHKRIVNIIKKLDIRRPQVMIEAVVVEFTPTDLLTFGVELIETKNARNRPQAITSFGLSSIVDEAGNPVGPNTPAFPAGRGVAAGPWSYLFFYQRQCY